MSSHPSNLLKEYGLKITPARSAILDLFFTSSKPLSVEEAARAFRSANLATIYRTILSFETAGIVKKVDLRTQTGSCHYELSEKMSDHHHHHLVCTSCGAIEDVEECLGSALERKVLARSKRFSAISQHSLEFFGTCKSCG